MFDSLLLRIHAGKSMHLIICMNLLIFLPLSACSVQQDMTDYSGKHECVILLHGLGRTSSSMDDIEERLQKAGYSTINLDYPSRKKSIETLAVQIIPIGLKRCRSASEIHFVTHSMGGILLRYYLSRYPIDNLGNTVMLSPPNNGSEVVDVLKENTLYKWHFGPAGQQLGTGPDSLAVKLGPVDYPVGIITGDDPAFFDFWLQDMIPGSGDGKVSVERAKVEGMADFLVLPLSHSFIMKEDEVIEQTIHFLSNGTFSH